MMLITDRALEDLVEIENFSVAKWGKRSAAKYVLEIEKTLVRLEENPQLLFAEEQLHSHLKFYLCKQHLLVFDFILDEMVLLSIIHASRDLPTILSEMHPNMCLEIDLLRKELIKKKQ